jgi:hypothetical protein
MRRDAGHRKGLLVNLFRHPGPMLDLLEQRAAPP